MCCMVLVVAGFEVLVDYLDLDKVAPFALDTAASGKQVSPVAHT